MTRIFARGAWMICKQNAKLWICQKELTRQPPAFWFSSNSTNAVDLRLTQILNYSDISPRNKKIKKKSMIILANLYKRQSSNHSELQDQWSFNETVPAYTGGSRTPWYRLPRTEVPRQKRKPILGDYRSGSATCPYAGSWRGDTSHITVCSINIPGPWPLFTRTLIPYSEGVSPFGSA